MTAPTQQLDKQTLHQRFERIRKLPKPLQDYIWSGQVERAYQSLLSKQQVQDARLRAIAADLVGKVLIGELHPNSFIRKLAEQGSIDIEKARTIARDVSAQVFAPVRNELMKVYDISGENKQAEPSIPAVPKQKALDKTPDTKKSEKKKPEAPKPKRTFFPGKKPDLPKTPDAPSPQPKPEQQTPKKPEPPKAPKPPQAVKPPAPAKPSTPQAPQAAQVKPPAPAPPAKPQAPAPQKPKTGGGAPSTQLPKSQPAPSSGPAVEHTPMKGSIAEAAANLHAGKTSIPDRQVKTAPPAAPPKQPAPGGSSPTMRPAQTLPKSPHSTPQQTEPEKPKGPALSPGELLAAEEVVAKEDGEKKKGLLSRIFGGKKEKKEKPSDSPPKTPPPSQKQSPKNNSGNTLNLRKPNLPS